MGYVIVLWRVIHPGYTKEGFIKMFWILPKFWKGWMILSILFLWLGYIEGWEGWTVNQPLLIFCWSLSCLIWFRNHRCFHQIIPLYVPTSAKHSTDLTYCWRLERKNPIMRSHQCLFTVTVQSWRTCFLDVHRSYGVSSSCSFQAPQIEVLANRHRL